MAINLPIIEFVNKSPEELRGIKKELELICITIDFILSKKEPENIKKSIIKKKNNSGRYGISEKVEALMIEIIKKHTNGATITDLYKLVKKTCKKEKWNVPSAPTFTRRYHKFNEKKPDPLVDYSEGPEIEVQGPPEKVNIMAIKEKLRISRIDKVQFAEDIR